MRAATAGWVAVVLAAAACNGGDKASDDTSGGNGGGDDSGGGDPVEAVCEEPAEVQCVDELILDLSLHDDKVSDGAVTTTTEGGDFVTVVDASAGGINEATNNPWVYVRFTADGAERVDIDDETALESMEWDMALRRFIIRLNGGSSGPSCVGAATFRETSYEDLAEIPEGLSYGVDDYYTDDCTIINDSSGLPGSPQVVLGGWWEYPGCVATTGYPHLIRRADGTVLKVVVETYYGEGQDTCNSANTPGSDSGIITMRWAWMD